MRQKISDELTLKRSQPQQGKPVGVQVYWNGLPSGELILPFAGWIKFNRLISHGVAMDKKEDGKLNVKVKVEGIGEEPATLPVREIAKFLEPKGLLYRGGISNVASDEEDEDIKAAEQQAKLDEAQAIEEKLWNEASQQNKTDRDNEQRVRLETREAEIRELQEKQQQQLVRSLRPIEGRESNE